jgi:hypothetical protein
MPVGDELGARRLDLAPLDVVGEDPHLVAAAHEFSRDRQLRRGVSAPVPYDL